MTVCFSNQFMVRKEHIDLHKFVLFITSIVLFVIIHPQNLLASAPIQLDPDHMNGNLIGRRIEYLEDKDRSLTDRDILKHDISSRFKTSNTDVLSFGFTSSVFWVRFDVKNIAAEDITWYLDYAFFNITRIDLYAAQDDRLERIKTLGSFYMQNSDINHVTHITRMRTKPGINRYYLRVQSVTSAIIPLKIWSPELLHEYIKKQTAIMSMLFGIILIMLVYHLFLYIVIHERQYGYFTLHIMFLLLQSLMLEGYGWLYFLPYNQMLLHLIFPVICASVLTGIQFSRIYLNTKFYFSKFDARVLKPLMAIFVLIIATFIPIKLSLMKWAPGAIFPYFTVISTLCFTVICAILAIAIYASIKKLREGYFFIIGYFSLFVGGVIYFFHDMNIAPLNTYTHFAFIIGIIIMLFLFAAGLGDRFARMRKQVINLNDDLNLKNIALHRSNEELFAANEELEASFEEMESQNQELISTQERLEILATVIEQAAEGIIITDQNGIIIFCNHAFETITGYSKNEAINRKPSFLKSGKHNEAFYNDLWKTITSGNIWSGLIINKKKDGTLIHEDTTISPIKNGSDKIINYVAIERDVTEQIILQNQLIQAQKMDSLGTLVSGLAHDFNNILGGIIGSASLMKIQLERKNSSSIEDELNCLELINSSSDRLADIIKQLLIFSRKHEPEMVLFDVNNAVQNVKKICENTFPKAVNLVFPQFEKSYQIIGEPTQIEQLFLNLCINASHSMTIMRKPDDPLGGNLEVSISSITADNAFCTQNPDAVLNTTYIEIDVADEGVGINDNIKERIFEPFYTTKEREKGTGLGLTIVYNIVKSHRGFITFYSKQGGTIFRVFLPACDKELETPKTIPNNALSSKKNGRILVIDDEEILLETTRMILIEGGFEVKAKKSAEEAIEYFRNNHEYIELIILDMSMPGMSGLEAYESFKEINPDVKVLIISGLPCDERISKGLKTGARDFLKKPFTANMLLNKINEIL
jgi:PAS domain S-box-containing protein